MLEDLRNRVKGLFQSSSSSDADHAGTTWQNRAQLVTSLQQEVRSLQQEITDLSEAEGTANGGADPEVDSEKMASLHSQLSRKQAELSRYQARV